MNNNNNNYNNNVVPPRKSLNELLKDLNRLQMQNRTNEVLAKLNEIDEAYPEEKEFTNEIRRGLVVPSNNNNNNNHNLNRQRHTISKSRE